MEKFDIPGWDGRYQITKCGKVFSMPRTGKGPTSGGWLKLKKYKSSRSKKEYMKVRMCRSGKRFCPQVHRLMGETFLGLTADQEIDHINGDTTDNRLSNLRVCSRSQNAANIDRPVGPSGYRGVTFCKRTGKWMAQCTHKRKNHFLGRFDCPEEAAKAWDVKAAELHGEFAKLNFNHVHRVA
jgi:hypothetical protein